MSDLNDFSPYPKTKDEVTADAMIRTGLVSAWANDARARSALRERNLAMDMLALAFGEAATEQFHVATLLAELADVAPERAEAAARRIWAERFDGAVVHELTFGRLAAMGIDPDAVASLVESTWRDAADKRAAA